MEEVILLKLGEIMLKGLNRHQFEAVLLRTVKRRLIGCGEFDCKCSQSTIYVTPKNSEADMDEAERRMGKIFGVVGYVRAAAVEKNLKEIQEMAVEYLKDELEDVNTFKVETRRSDKKFELKSPEVSAEVGGYLLEAYPNLTVDVHNPEMTVRVEIRETKAFIHGGIKEGAGGIPVGTGGRAAIMISGGLDSPVAAWHMAKRGVELVGIHFASPPYTSELAHQKVVKLLEKVSEYAGRMKMITVEFTHLQEEIRDKCPEEVGTVILRRCMIRAAEKIANDENCLALITGESLGQVASQTMQAIACTDAVADMPVFRPLIGTDKSEIVKTAYRIDTFETSIEPYEDCCTIFTPKHPKTKPSIKFIEKSEQKIDIEALIDEALENLRITQIR